MPETAFVRDDIIGGNAITDYPAVAFTSTGGGNCTGTLIAPRVVLSAAHCVHGASGGTVSFGNSAGTFTEVRVIEQLFPHRFYDPGAIRNFDIALIRIDQAPAGIDPLPFNLTPLGEAQIGASARVIGFGVTDGANETGAGTKREIVIPTTNVTDEHVVLGNSVQNICFGDSGGPTFMTIGGQERVVAVSSFTTGTCNDDSFVTRVDKYGDDMVKEVVAAWSGPCQEDGECVTDGCGEFADPDCDPCGLEGTCATGCEKVDLDCPKGALDGKDCLNNDQCESRNCVQALDDPAVFYCTTDCASDDDCTAPLASCQQTADGESHCVFADQTPGALGTDCEVSDDCRSGICDQSAGICANMCGEGDPECPKPFSCIDYDDVKICTKPAGGGCAASPRLDRNAFVLGLLALFGVVAILRVRKR